MSFDGLGLDPRLQRALHKLGITSPTPIQEECIPVSLSGHDVVGRARTGSGKTLAYLLPALHRILSAPALAAWQAVVLVPTRELCNQVQAEGSKLAGACGVADLRITALAGDGLPRSAIARAGQVVVATPAKLAQALNTGALKADDLKERLLTLVLDEADLLLAYGYEDDIKAIAPHVPRSCQCLLLSATSSEEVETLSKLVLHNAKEIDLLRQTDGASAPGGGVAAEVSHWYLDLGPSARSSKQDTLERLLRTLALLRYGLVPQKVLIFVNSVDSGLRLRLFLEAFGLRAALAHGEQPLNSRYHALQEFNRGLYDYLIATDDIHAGDKKRKQPKGDDAGDNSNKRKRGKDEEFGVTRGIDFKGVSTVINFEMPATERGYVHRLGRTGRAGRAGMGISLVGKRDQLLLERVKLMLTGSSDDQHPDATSGEQESRFQPFAKLSKTAVDGFRYRGEDVARSITKTTLAEARTRDLKAELLNSERLSAFFEEHPNDLQLLKHDRPLGNTKAASATHLKHLPSYLRDPTLGGKSFVGNAGKGKLSKKKRRKTLSVDPIKGISRFSKSDAPTDIELKAEEKGRKERRKLEKKQAQLVPKRNVRKNKARKR